MNENNLWEQLGDLSEEDSNQTLMRLFSLYEEENEKGLNQTCCQDFFRKLSLAISQCQECNLNRR